MSTSSLPQGGTTWLQESPAELAHQAPQSRSFLSATSDPTPPPAALPWIHWTQAFASLAGLVRTAGTIVQQKVTDQTLAGKILDGLHAFYDSIKAVDQAFLDEINAIETGTPITITIQPAPIPDWNPSSKPDIVDSAWQALAPVLQSLMQELAQKGGNASVVADAISQFINNSTTILNDLRPLFQQANQ